MLPSEIKCNQRLRVFHRKCLKIGGFEIVCIPMQSLSIGFRFRGSGVRISPSAPVQNTMLPPNAADLALQARPDFSERGVADRAIGRSSCGGSKSATRTRSRSDVVVSGVGDRERTWQYRRDPERSSGASASKNLRQCLPALDDRLAATCNHSRTTKFTNRPETAISFTIVLSASSSFTRRSDFTSAISASAGISASPTILCRSRPFSWTTYSR